MQPSILRNQPDVGRHFTHHVLADAARGIAGEFYEQMATGQKYRGKLHPKARKAANDFYKAWPDQKLFVEARWQEFIDTARSALAAMLGRPDLSETVKADIHEALRLDSLVNPRKLSPEAALAASITANIPKR